MEKRRRVVTEWDDEESAEETGAPSLGKFFEHFGAALWPVAAMALVVVVVILWAVFHYS